MGNNFLYICSYIWGAYENVTKVNLNLFKTSLLKKNKKLWWITRRLKKNLQKVENFGGRKMTRKLKGEVEPFE